MSDGNSKTAKTKGHGFGKLSFEPTDRSCGDLRANHVLADPPINMSDENLRQDVRWKFGTLPVNNANYAWIHHFIHHLSPVGVAGFVMANGSMSTQTSNEGEIRKAIIEADLAITWLRCRVNPDISKAVPQIDKQTPKELIYGR